MSCVLRDAPRLRQIAPQHDGMFVNRRKKIVILRCLAKRGLEGRTTFFQLSGIPAQPRSAFRLSSRSGIVGRCRTIGATGSRAERSFSR